MIGDNDRLPILAIIMHDHMGEAEVTRATAGATTAAATAREGQFFGGGAALPLAVNGRRASRATTLSDSNVSTMA